jgi:protein-disulfide isomerase
MKKVVTIAVIVLVCVGVGYWLFKLSPQDQTNQSVGYNAYLTTTGAKPISTPPPFDPNTDHYQGSPTAKNQFIEYGDMECPACAEYAPILNNVTSTFPSTVFVFRYFPLVQIHPNTVEAALAVEAAGAQGEYWPMHNLMYADQSSWESLSDPLSAFDQYAQQVGVKDINQFNSDVTSRKYLPGIIQDNDEAIGLNLQGTPTFFFNGHQLQNADLPTMLAQAQQWINK